MEMVYYQPKGINKKYCEVGTIYDTDPDYIRDICEPCKHLISAVKIIPSEFVTYDKKSRSYIVTKQ